ncbi:MULTISPECIES: hypothetical protein [Erythrobacter]|uniref:hypothetical protein n=1 Tax=Erythrobacter TaxID=1041 RepID=UPI000B18DF00|nr:hypothetical protein [Erythrobacter litoralis]MEE4337688.1 hypothetical protein [Erythrobacter sp.]
MRIELHARESDPGPWIEQFLDLERAGWKGRGGSALACERSNADLFRKTVCKAGWRIWRALRRAGRCWR